MTPHKAEPEKIVKKTPDKRAGNGFNGVAGPGRPKGIPNKMTMSVKAAIEAAAEGLGGSVRMIAWAQEDPLNERAFWSTIYPKLLPLQVSGEGGGPLVVEIVKFAELVKYAEGAK